MQPWARCDPRARRRHRFRAARSRRCRIPGSGRAWPGSRLRDRPSGIAHRRTSSGTQAEAPRNEVLLVLPGAGHVRGFGAAPVAATDAWPIPEINGVVAVSGKCSGNLRRRPIAVAGPRHSSCATSADSPNGRAEESGTRRHRDRSGAMPWRDRRSFCLPRQRILVLR